MKVGCLHCNQSPCPCPLTHKLVPYPQNKHNNNKVPPSSSNRGLLWWILVADMGSTSNNFNLLREIFPINIWWAEERGTQGHREHCYVDIIGYWIRDVVSVGWNTFLSQPARLSYPLGQRGKNTTKTHYSKFWPARRNFDIFTILKILAPYQVIENSAQLSKS